MCWSKKLIAGYGPVLTRMASIPAGIVERILQQTEDLWHNDHKTKFREVLAHITMCRHRDICILECITAGHGFTSMGQCSQCGQRFYYDG